MGGTIQFGKRFTARRRKRQPGRSRSPAKTQLVAVRQHRPKAVWGGRTGQRAFEYVTMSEPSNQPAPRYIVCNCKHCDGHIEFDANEFAEDNSIVPCPHCGLETKIFIPISQVEKEPTDLAPSVDSQNALKREGLFCGEVAVKEIGTSAGSEPLPSQEPQTQISISEADQNPAPIANIETPILQKHDRIIFSKRARFILTPKQCETPIGQELVCLLIEIERDGFVTEQGVRRLNEWLESKSDSKILAILYLLDLSRHVLSCGKLTNDAAFEMQLAIERVLPKPIRRPILLKRYEAQKTLPAGEQIIAEIRKLGGNPPPGLTRLESFQLESNLSSPATENQIAYIRRLGGNPHPTINLQEASDLIQELLHSVKATEKQLDFIRSLGGNPPWGLSRAGAEELIPRLLAEEHEKQAREKSPTSRQMMVLRFWNRTDLLNASQWEVEKWLTQFYNEDPRRKEAWEVFKKENGDDGSQHDPSWVPIGVGESYLVKLR